MRAVVTVATALFLVLFVLMCVGAVTVGLHLRRKIRTGTPRLVSTWDEQVVEPDCEPDRGPPVVVLGAPGLSHRMVCRGCVTARADGRYNEICDPCRPLLIGKAAI